MKVINVSRMTADSVFPDLPEISSWFDKLKDHKIKELKGKTFRANFYKCGDMLSVPHYVTWNPVGTKKPDYHQPAYFGLLKFI
jgi:hypothetical protein